MELEGNKRVFTRLGQPSHNTKQQRVCFQWRAGNCTRSPCPFLHREVAPPSDSNGLASKRPHAPSDDQFLSDSNRRHPNFSQKWGRVHGGAPKSTDKVCTHWVKGQCRFGERCRFVHSWCLGDCFSLLTRLEGHQKVVSGIALPSSSDKLYTGSKDETVRVLDCQSGQCVGVINLGAEVGCMISEGSWVFVGLPNVVKAWNTQTNMDISLNGPAGQVNALIVGNDFLFAGIKDGSILVWKFNAASSSFDPAASLKGHTLAVVSLVVGNNRLFSGSIDHSIRVWSLDTLACIETLVQHTSAVTSLLCWDQFLLSCSLDQTIKVWAFRTEKMEVTFTHNEDNGVLSLCGMHDAESKPVLICSCTDNTVRVYDLPSFAERGKMFTAQEVRAMKAGPDGLFFTGDGAGEVRVWKWASS